MYQNDSIFHIELDKIKPNPYQPRREFDEGKLTELAESIRQYGVLQPLVVTRVEIETDDGLKTEYELIAGERRLRAAQKAGLAQIPAIIRASEDNDRMKLELAIIENLQREDLNAVDRALAFQRLVDEFGFKHTQVAKKVGKSREYVSNTLRLLSLSQEILDGLARREINEGHTRPLLMLADRPEEQVTLYKEITHKKLSVRDAEKIARRVASDKVRRRELDPDMLEFERKMTDLLGTRVYIDRREVGGKVTIDFFSTEDLSTLLEQFKTYGEVAHTSSEDLPPQHAEGQPHSDETPTEQQDPSQEPNLKEPEDETLQEDEEAKPETQESKTSEKEDPEDLYAIRNFSL